MTTNLRARFLDALHARAGISPGPGQFEPNLNVLPLGSPIGLAVSGGGDSMAMLHLATGLDVRVVTVDHGLRPESAAEAAEVGRICAGLGLRHDVLRWHWDGRGNLQDAARRGRRAMMADWAMASGVGAVALAHTRDDVAETFVMRLARGAGVDGLSAMRAAWVEGGVTWLRPLLAMSRAELRTHLRAVGATWVEDPSNDNTRFDRVKVRKALAVLRPLGIDAERLAAVAGHLADARAALETATADAATQVLQPGPIATRIDRDALARHSAEVQRRLLLMVIAATAPAFYPPRGAAVLGLLARLLAGKDSVLSGCRFQVLRGQLWAYREVAAVQAMVSEPGQLWDGRWRMDGPAGSQVRALAAGISLCPDWRATGLPRAALLASPSLWQGDQLLAAPFAGLSGGGDPLFPVAGMHHSGLAH